MPTALGIPPIAQSASNTALVDALIWVGVAVLVIVAGGVVLLIARRRLLAKDDDAGSSLLGTLRHLEHLRDTGEISQDEFERARAGLIGPTAGSNPIREARAARRHPDTTAPPSSEGEEGSAADGDDAAQN
jgi:hypothetical protein